MAIPASLCPAITINRLQLSLAGIGELIRNLIYDIPFSIVAIKLLCRLYAYTLRLRLHPLYACISSPPASSRLIYLYSSMYAPINICNTPPVYEHLRSYICIWPLLGLQCPLLQSPTPPYTCIPPHLRRCVSVKIR